jgi:CHASE3 domain sensor protein
MQAPQKHRPTGSSVHGGLHSLAIQIFTATAVLMIGALVLMSFSLSGLKTSRHDAEVTENTLLEITTVESRLLDSDRLLNGHAISRNPAFAARSAVIAGEIDASMAKLARSVATDPVAARIYREIAGRLAARQQFFRYLAEHLDEVEQSPVATAEQSLTTDMRIRLWRLLVLERTKRIAEHTGMIREAERSLWIAVGIMALAIIAGAASLYLAGLGRRPA